MNCPNITLLLNPLLAFCIFINHAHHSLLVQMKVNTWNFVNKHEKEKKNICSTEFINENASFSTILPTAVLKEKKQFLEVPGDSTSLSAKSCGGPSKKPFCCLLLSLNCRSPSNLWQYTHSAYCQHTLRTLQSTCRHKCTPVKYLKCRKFI